MTKSDIKKRTRARESSNAIERLYITMRHLLNRGFYKPYGVSGNTLKQGLLMLRPEIYGDIASTKSELHGLKYVMDRLPEGIEQCRVIYMTDNEGYKLSQFKAIINSTRGCTEDFFFRKKTPSIPLKVKVLSINHFVY